MTIELHDCTPGLSTDVKKPNVLHVFCRNVSLVAIDPERSVYESLLRVVKKLHTWDDSGPGELDNMTACDKDTRATRVQATRGVLVSGYEPTVADVFPWP